MAQLKDSVVMGKLRVTDEVLTTGVQMKTISAPTASNGTTYGPGSDGQVLKSNGTSIYWAADNNTTYSSQAAASGGTTLSLVTTGEKYTWNNKSTLAIGTTATTAAAGNHTHGLSLAADSGTSSITLAANTKYKLTAGGSTYIFTTPPDNNTTYSSKTAASGGTDVSLVTTGEKYTWNNKSTLAIGTTATTAAAGNHTHGLSLAADSGTSSISLAANTKYKLTAGGSTYVFTTPSDTTYSSKTAASGGTDVSLVTTGEKYTWNNKTSLTIGTTATTAAAGNHTHSDKADKSATVSTVTYDATNKKLTKTINGTTSDIVTVSTLKSAVEEPIMSKTYTNVIATANDQNGAGFFYLKVRGTTYNSVWHVKVRVRATVPGQVLYEQDSYFDLWGCANTYPAYRTFNAIRHTSYRPIYYHSAFLVSETGYNNNCGTWMGFSLFYSTNNTNASYKRTVIVDLLEYEDCTVEMVDTLVTPTNIPNRASNTSWYASTNTSYTNLDGTTNGYTTTGDRNSTTISNLNYGNGNHVAGNQIYRYQLLFHTDINTLAALNNVDNGYNSTTKAMNTSLEFDPMLPIYYYATTTAIAANAAIGVGSLLYSISSYDCRYTFNCGTTLTAHQPLYLKCTRIASTGMFKIASASPWAQALPTSNDDTYYLLLGRTYSTYQAALYPHHPIYFHDGTGIKRYNGRFNVTKALSAVGSASAGTAIPADDITAWSAGTMFSASVSGEVLTLTAGTAPSLSYTAKSIPNISVSSVNVVTDVAVT